MLRGAQTTMTELRSAILLMSSAPATWRPEKATSLGGVIVSPHNITAEDLEVLRTRQLPHYIFTETELAGPRIFLGQRQAARQMTEELLRLGHKRFGFLSGFDPVLDTIKRCGFHDALKDAGIDPAHAPEIAAEGGERGAYRAANDLLQLKVRPTGVLATDDSLGAMLSNQARRQFGLKVPDDLSIVGFHDWPYLSCIEPRLTTVHFEFFTAGQRAAEALSNAALTGEPLKDLHLEPTYRPGQTVGPAPKP